MKRFILTALAAALGFASFAGPAAPVAAQDATGAVKPIDGDCLAIQNAIMALQPIHLALVSGKWKVFSEGDYAVVEQTHASITFADAWKQGTNPAWVHVHSFNAAGDQRATQLCFRQSDGTLERARQSTTVPGLGAASAQAAYFSSDGTLIQKTTLFEINDPAMAKKVTALPFYNVLP